MTQYGVQYMDEGRDEAQANEMLAGLALQSDYLGGRVIAPSPSEPGWRVQAIFEDCNHDLPLPEGCRRVVLLPNWRAHLRVASDTK